MTQHRPDPDWSDAFAANLAAKPWLHAYGELPPGTESLACEALPVQGRIPEGLSGVLRRILAVRHEVGGQRYHHWWDGDGMLAEFTLRGQSISHRARIIDTPKYRAEKAAGRMVYQQFGTALPGLVKPADLDEMNPANVNILEHGGELLALGDFCSAWRLDPETLAGLGPKAWSPQTAGAPFSAHPRVDRTGTLYSIGYAPWKNSLTLYRIGADGALQQSAVLDPGPFGLVHDFIVTERHLLIPIPSTVWSREREAAGHAMLDCLVWQPQLPVRVLVVDKHSLTVTRTVELPPGMVYHCANGYDRPDGSTGFHCCWFGDASYMFGTFRAVMQGELQMGAPPLQMWVDIPAAGSTASLRPVGGIGELPRVDERLMGQAFRQVWLGSPGAGEGPPTQFGFGALTRLDLDSGRTDTFDFGPDVIVEEPAFAPRPGSSSEGDGWMVGTYFDIRARTTKLAIFDALHMSDGPLATATLPYSQPIGVHGNFYPAS